jgi:cytochrome c oxidase assembly protein subunit 15
VSSRGAPRGLHRFACLVAGATFLLLIAGGLVTSTGSGLAVPDWPLSFGMVFPPMVGGIFFEHGHRMVAGSVTVLMFILMVWLARREPRRWVRGLGYAAMGAIVLQAVLGGVTVLLLLPPVVSATHACLAQTFFCLTVTIALVTSPRWRAASAQSAGAADRTAARLALASLAAVYVQLILGAVMRHMDAGVAIPTFPLAWGRLVPDHWSTQIALHYAHRVWALVVTGAVLGQFVRIARAHRDRPELLRPSLLLAGLIPVQIALGALTVLTFKHPAVATAHLATGALVLATNLVLAIRIWRPEIERRTALRGATAIPGLPQTSRA